MRKMSSAWLLIALSISFAGCCIIENQLFPIWERNDFKEPPTEPGPYDVLERRVDVEDGADGSPFGITVFEPNGAEGPLPAFIWVMGSNVQAYYHQSLHEILASWGYAVLVPDTRPLRFTDAQYHHRLVLLAQQTLDLALAGDLGLDIAADQVAAGGYSIGGPLAAFLAARRSTVTALVYWAPSGSPVWQGLNPADLYPKVTAPSLYVLGELDQDAPPDGGFPDQLQADTPQAPTEEFVIPGAVHHQFQQPTGADDFSANPEITRFEQQGIAIKKTLDWLDGQFGITRDATE